MTLVLRLGNERNCHNIVCTAGSGSISFIQHQTLIMLPDISQQNLRAESIYVLESNLNSPVEPCPILSDMAPLY